MKVNLRVIIFSIGGFILVFKRILADYLFGQFHIYCPHPPPGNQFATSWASKLTPPMPKAVYSLLSEAQVRKGRRHFQDHQSLHPDLVSAWPNCPSEHQSNPQPKLGRPVDEESQWHQLRTEFPSASDSELKRKHSELARSQTREDANAHTEVVINVDAFLF